jgi:VanZ family protein
MINALRHRGLWLAIGWGLITVTWIGSLLPARDLHLIRDVPDKLQHASMYFVMSLWFAGVYARHSLPRIGLAFFLMGCAVELAQGVFTATRQMDWRDVVANSVGIAIALAVAYLGASGWAARVERVLAGRRVAGD